MARKIRRFAFLMGVATLAVGLVWYLCESLSNDGWIFPPHASAFTIITGYDQRAALMLVGLGLIVTWIARAWPTDPQSSP